MLPGVHKVRKRLASGEVAEYWYAFRGGPCILRARAKSDALLAKEVARGAAAAAVQYEAQTRQSDAHLLYGLISKYLESRDFKGLAPRTQKDRRKFLDQARAEIGHMELKALRASGARGALLRWRDRYKDTPKTADELLGAVSTVLQWGHDNDECGPNPLRGFRRLYKSNRAEAVWEQHHLDALGPHCAPELWHAVQLAILTGLRLGDLIKLPWSAVGEHTIRRTTGKSSGRTTVSIPLTDELRALLADIPRCDSTTILNSARKRPWTLAGLGSAMTRAKQDAKDAAAANADGSEARSGIEHLRFHDFRGTAATNFIRAGLTIDEVALILGWEKRRVEAIAVRYVTGDAIGAGMAERLRQNKARTHFVNQGVNQPYPETGKIG